MSHDKVSKQREELERARTSGDHCREALLRGELVKLHRRALRRALALDDAKAAAEINRQMADDLAPIVASEEQCAHAMILDVKREHARQIIATLGPFELERLSTRPERFLAITESADAAVQITACLKDEEAVEAFYRQLIATMSPIDIRHDLETGLVARLEAVTDSFVAFGVGGTA